MSVVALAPGYTGIVADSEDRFHGKRLLYIGWDDHLLFCAPVCLPLPAAMPFGALLVDVLPGVYGSHPDFEKIDWAEAQWFASGEPFVPDAAKSLAENRLVHKSVIRFRVPGLKGIKGSHS